MKKVSGRTLNDLGHRDLVRLNADERTLELRRQFPDAVEDDLNLQAAQAVDKDVEKCIEGGRSFVVETVLSSPKYRDDVLTAKVNGFKIGLIYVSLHPPELSPQRVSERVAKGGHHVDAAKTIARHGRSHEELRWFAPQADIFMAFDNSDPNATPVLLASRAKGEPLQYRVRGLNPALDRVLDDMRAKPFNPDVGPA